MKSTYFIKAMTPMLAMLTLMEFHDFSSKFTCSSESLGSGLSLLCELLSTSLQIDLVTTVPIVITKQFAAPETRISITNGDFQTEDICQVQVYVLVILLI